MLARFLLPATGTQRTGVKQKPSQQANVQPSEIERHRGREAEMREVTSTMMVQAS